MTDKEVIAIYKKWKHRLGLDDWQIDFIPNCNPNQFSNRNSCGETEYAESIKCAVIKIIDETYGYVCAPYAPLNIEKIIVHELLHLKFCFLDDSDNEIQNRIVHQLIDDLARAITFKEDK